MIAGFVLKSPTDRGLRTHLKKNLTNAQTATLLEFVAQTFLFKIMSTEGRFFSKYLPGDVHISFILEGSL